MNKKYNNMKLKRFESFDYEKQVETPKINNLIDEQETILRKVNDVIKSNDDAITLDSLISKFIVNINRIKRYNIDKSTKELVNDNITQMNEIIKNRKSKRFENYDPYKYDLPKLPKTDPNSVNSLLNEVQDIIDSDMKYEDKIEKIKELKRKNPDLVKDKRYIQKVIKINYESVNNENKK